LAVIGDSVTINAYATVGAYAVIDNYAVVDTYATVDDYATVAANLTVPANTTVSIPTTFVGNVQTRLAFVTTVPLVPAGQGGGDGEGDDEAAGGGLHCMTSGFGTQGLMFLGLLATGFMVRRKKR